MLGAWALIPVTSTDQSVAIQLFAIIVQPQVVYEAPGDTVPAPIAFNFVRIQVDPDRWAASCYQQLGTQVTLLSVHIISYIVGPFHPAASCLFLLLSCFFVGDHLRAGDAVRNVLAHPAKLFFACLTFLFYCTHDLPP